MLLALEDCSTLWAVWWTVWWTGAQRVPPMSQKWLRWSSCLTINIEGPWLLVLISSFPKKQTMRATPLTATGLRAQCSTVLARAAGGGRIARALILFSTWFTVRRFTINNNKKKKKINSTHIIIFCIIFDIITFPTSI